MVADMWFRNSWAAWNPNQGMCNVLWQKFVIELCGEKKQVFLQSFNKSKCIGIDLSMVEELFSLLF